MMRYGIMLDLVGYVVIVTGVTVLVPAVVLTLGCPEPGARAPGRRPSQEATPCATLSGASGVLCRHADASDSPRPRPPRAAAVGARRGRRLRPDQLVLGHRAEPVRARRPVRVLLLEPGTAADQPGLLPVARGLSRGGALPAARRQLQLHRQPRRAGGVLLRQPVRRARHLDAVQRHGDAAVAGVPRQPGLGGRPAARRAHPAHQRPDHRAISARATCSATRVRRRTRPACRWRSSGRRATGEEKSATLVKRAVTIPTVSALRLYDRRRPQGRLPELPQLRAAVVWRARHRVRAAARGRRDRAGARPALQRRRAGRRRAAPGQPDRRHADAGSALRRVLPQRRATPTSIASCASRASRTR